MGNPSQRRRANNNDRIDPTRRRSEMRRRSSSGWESVDYSRRRGYSGSTVAAASALGFAAGIAVGSRIQQPGMPPYYYHHSGWTDMNGVYHQSGYYGSDGYYFSNSQAIGYCPPYSAPDYYAGCGSGGYGRQNNSSGLGVLLLCCCIAGLILYMICKKSDDGGSGADQTPLLSVGDPMTREGQTVPRGNAILFLRALEAEYLDGAEGEIGKLFESWGGDGNLACEEDAVRQADDKQDAVFQLAVRWGMRYELSRR